jgi:hypothetical protein
MAENLYDQLFPLDAGIANVYRKAVGNRANGVIDKTEANAIFNKAIDGKTITTSEAKALHLILRKAQFKTGVKQHLKDRIREKATRNAIVKGTGKWVDGEKELANVTAALGTDYVGKVNFKSPETKVLYQPNYYAVIKKLIDDMDILVFRLHAAELNESAGLGGGFYRSGSEAVFLYEGMPLKNEIPLIVHEVTHSIQDWLDINSKVKYIEADAYIAQAVVCHLLGRKFEEDSEKPLPVAFFHAAPMVLEGDGNMNNPHWRPAYLEVVKAVGKHHIYQHKKDDPRKFKKKGENKERKEFIRLLRALKNNPD